MNVTGHNSRKLWADITSAIKTVYLQKESALISATNKYTSSRSEVVLYSQNTVLLLYIESVFLHSIKISLKFQKFLWNGSIWFCLGWGFECLPDGGERLTSAWYWNIKIISSCSNKICGKIYPWYICSVICVAF